MTPFHSYEDGCTEFKRELTNTLEKEVVAFFNSAKQGEIYTNMRTYISVPETQ